jgi:hypothetical protein
MSIPDQSMDARVGGVHRAAPELPARIAPTEATRPPPGNRVVHAICIAFETFMGTRPMRRSHRSARVSDPLHHWALPWGQQWTGRVNICCGARKPFAHTSVQPSNAAPSSDSASNDASIDKRSPTPGSVPAHCRTFGRLAARTVDKGTVRSLGFRAPITKPIGTLPRAARRLCRHGRSRAIRAPRLRKLRPFRRRSEEYESKCPDSAG